jgi:rhamnulokinase
MLRKFGLPARIFPKIIMPGKKLGTLRRSIAEKTGLKNVRVIAPPSHDTACAVAAAPANSSRSKNWAFISSGTWSLMGIEMQKPTLSQRARQLNLTNEGGVDGTYRLMRNIMGLWLVQQCRRTFEKQCSYAELARMAGRCEGLRSVVDPDDARFFNPPDMAKAMQAFCRETKQAIPKTPGQLVRCAYESLAVKYRQVLANLQEVSGRRIEVIHVVGGGSQSGMLNQFTADACERPVIAGPVEATAMGNILVQMRAGGEIDSLARMRAVVRKSCRLRRYEPRENSAWRDAANRIK